MAALLSLPSGYRADRIIQLAKSFLHKPITPCIAPPTTTPTTTGNKAKKRKISSSSNPASTTTSTITTITCIDIKWLESPLRSDAEVYGEVLSWHGFGPYAASTICQLLGHYGRIPSDTEVSEVIPRT